MDTLEIEITAPPHIRSEWLMDDPTRSRINPSRTTLACYDPVTRSGGVFDLALRLWTISGPMSIEVFEQCLKGDLAFHADEVTGRIFE